MGLLQFISLGITERHSLLRLDITCAAVDPFQMVLLGDALLSWVFLVLEELHPPSALQGHDS